MARRSRRLGIALSLAALLPLVGCYGSFGLVRKVHKLNAEITRDKWGREGVFLLLNIPFVSVYGLSAFLDAIFFNAYEFWTGETLLAEQPHRLPDEAVANSGSAPPAPAQVAPAPAPARAPVRTPEPRRPRKR